MSKIYLKAEVRITIETELTDMDDILEGLDFNAQSLSEDIDIYDFGVDKFQVEDAK